MANINSIIKRSSQLPHVADDATGEYITERQSKAAVAPLIVHVVFRLDIGGLERLLLDLIARSPKNLRHAIICMTEYTELSQLLSEDVACYALHKKPGKDPASYWRLRRLLKQLKPAIVQTYNIGCIEANVSAWLAGVPSRLHAEHGRTADDPHGTNRKHKLLRRLMQPFIHRYIAVSRQLGDWLIDNIGIQPHKVLCIYNGIDLERYHPETESAATVPWPTEFAQDHIVMGTVGRLDPVKDQRTLLQAFSFACDHYPQESARWRLAIIGEGPQRRVLEEEIERLGLGERVWLAGRRDDVPALLARFDVFALASIAEGIPLTVLEAMAMRRPVVATAVGGVPEVVVSGECGLLAPPCDPQKLADALATYARDPQLRLRHGAAARERIESRFNVIQMAEQYFSLYTEMAGVEAAELQINHPERA